MIETSWYIIESIIGVVPMYTIYHIIENSLINTAASILKRQLTRSSRTQRLNELRTLESGENRIRVNFDEETKSLYFYLMI